jgi:predicted AlkP superfamily phosphohydrolase/phosphomutase
MGLLDRFRRARRPQVAVFGLDGVSFGLIEALTRSGDMPFLARLRERGTTAAMRSTIPTISSVSWTGFMTGTNPGKHGIYGFTDVKPGTMTLYFPNYANVRAPTLWDVAGRAGRRSIVINIPNTYPARELNGVLVSGFVAINMERAVYPPTLLPLLRERGYRIDVDYQNANERAEAFFADCAATLDARRAVLRHCLTDEPWDLFIGCITETDRLHHYFWDQYADPDAPHHGRFLDFYRRLDRVLEELIGALPEGCPVFIVSDHGHTLIEHEFYPNVWLREQGLLACKTATPKSVADLDPATKVFALDPGRIYLHRRGRFPLGTVEDGAEAEDLLARVSEGLAAVRADGTAHAAPVSRVYRRDELYAGPCLAAAPDLVLHFHPGFDIKGAMGKTSLFGRSPLTGMHTYDDSLFFVNRRGVSVPELSILHLAPTILRLLGVDPPADLDAPALRLDGV